MAFFNYFVLNFFKLFTNKILIVLTIILIVYEYTIILNSQFYIS